MYSLPIMMAHIKNEFVPVVAVAKLRVALGAVSSVSDSEWLHGWVIQDAIKSVQYDFHLSGADKIFKIRADAALAVAEHYPFTCAVADDRMVFERCRYPRASVETPAAKSVRATCAGVNDASAMPKKAANENRVPTSPTNGRLNMRTIKVIHAFIGENYGPTVNARDIYDVAGGRAPFSVWITPQIRKAGLVEGSDYQKRDGSIVGSGRPPVDYVLTLPSAIGAAYSLRRVAKASVSHDALEITLREEMGGAVARDVTEAAIASVPAVVATPISEFLTIDSRDLGDGLVPTINARRLHEWLGVGRDFTNWITGRLAEYGFAEGVDFVCSPIPASEKFGRGGHNKTDYHITLDVAKELAMVERNEKGREARQHFIECEKKLKATQANGAWTIGDLIGDPDKVLALIGGQAKIIKEQGAEIATLKPQVANLEAAAVEAAPKVDFYKRYVVSDGNYGLQNAAVSLGLDANLLAKLLRENDLLQYRSGRLVPYYLNKRTKYFIVKNVEKDGKSYPQTFATPTGMAYFAKMIPTWRAAFDAKRDASSATPLLDRAA
jgi:anti-repressor protein